jgi:hypothetical protein
MKKIQLFYTFLLYNFFVHLFILYLTLSLNKYIV